MYKYNYHIIRPFKLVNDSYKEEVFLLMNFLITLITSWLFAAPQNTSEQKRKGRCRKYVFYIKYLKCYILYITFQIFYIKNVFIFKSHQNFILLNFSLWIVFVLDYLLLEITTLLIAYIWRRHGGTCKFHMRSWHGPTTPFFF